MPRSHSQRLVGRHAVGMAADRSFQRLAGDVFHDDPAVVLLVLADVVQGEQVGMLEIQAVRDAAQLDVEIAADQLQRHFLAGVADGEIDLAEAAAARRRA